MRADLRRALQARWDQSLAERAAISPGSPLPLLNELLTTHLKSKKMISQIPPAPGQSENRMVG
jgi:hypothetical protein